MTYDVIVIGCGYAGAVAAIAAHDSGARVLILEKQPDPGGISVCSAGGVRIAEDADAAFAYLSATNADTSDEAVLRSLADGMTTVADRVRALASECGATVGIRRSPGNYPFPGADTFGFATIDDIRNFDPARDFPHVRGSPAGARLFRVVLTALERRTIELRTNTPALELLPNATGVRTPTGDIHATRAIILATGGFESDAALQRRTWQIKPVLSAAVRENTGDGIRMAQSAGAGLWHMWHFHGSYGFRHPDPAYPFGIRLKRLPDWTPGQPLRNDVAMPWILLDRAGRRFMNEYDPYMQDTGHRALEHFDPITQTYPRIPATLLLDSAGREKYTLSAPTWHDRAVAARFGSASLAEFDTAILTRADTLDDLARAFDLPADAMADSIAAWNAACAGGIDSNYHRPPGSMLPIAAPPYFAAHVWPIVSNTQGGPVHDSHQRVLDAFGRPIPNLFVAGELGSAFGHLYMSGGNLAECFIGGGIAGRNAASNGTSA